MSNLGANIIFGISMVLIVIWFSVKMFSDAKKRGELNAQTWKESTKKAQEQPAAENETDWNSAENAE